MALIEQSFHLPLWLYSNRTFIELVFLQRRLSLSLSPGILDTLQVPCQQLLVKLRDPRSASGAADTDIIYVVLVPANA